MALWYREPATSRQHEGGHGQERLDGPVAQVEMQAAAHWSPEPAAVMLGQRLGAIALLPEVDQILAAIVVPISALSTLVLARGQNPAAWRAAELCLIVPPFP